MPLREWIENVKHVHAIMGVLGFNPAYPSGDLDDKVYALLKQLFFTSIVEICLMQNTRRGLLILVKRIEYS
jgi:hypothetical protein